MTNAVMVYSPSLRRERKERYQRVAALLENPLTPQEYCEKWVPRLCGIEPDEQGFRKAAIRELSRITMLQQESINNWGKGFVKAPKWVPRMLKMADLLNQVAADWESVLKEED